MVASRSSFAGERPIHEKLEEQLGLQSRLMNEMGRNAAQVQAAEYQIALPALPPSVGTDSFAQAFAGAASNIANAVSQRVANNNSNNNNRSQPQQPQQQATSMWSSYGWPSIANSYNRYG